jgi:hypothetical protein
MARIEATDLPDDASEILRAKGLAGARDIEAS